MEKNEYLEEILKILNEVPTSSGLLKTVAGERYLERAVFKLAGHLAELKSTRQEILRDPDDAKLESLCLQIKVLLEKRERVKKSDLHLSPEVSRLFLAGDSSESHLIRSAVVENAEEWVAIVKGIYNEINVPNNTLSQDKAFWCRFHEKITDLQNFHVSDEYQFLSSCLEKNGNIVMKYTLESLFRSDKIHGLSEKFVNFYAGLNCNFEHLKNDCPDEFISAVSCFLKEAVRITRQPRIVQRTVFRLVNKLRDDILQSFYDSPYWRHYELLQEYAQFTPAVAPIQDENTTQISTITVEELRGIGNYLWVVEQTCLGLELIKYCKDLEMKEEAHLLEETVRHYHASFKWLYDCERRLGERAGSVSPSGHIGLENLVDFDQSEAYVNVLEAISANFVAQAPGTDIVATIAILEKFKGVSKYAIFRSRTSKVQENYLTCMNEALLDKIKDSTSAGLLELMRTVALLESGLSFFSESLFLGSVKGTVGLSKERIRKYLESIHYDIYDLPVLKQRHPKGDGWAEDSIGNGRPIDAIEFNQLDSIFGEIGIANEINAYFGLVNIRNIVAELESIKSVYLRLKTIVERYCWFIKEESEMFYSEKIEELILRLINLKWKYVFNNVNEERLNESERALSDIEVRHFTFTTVINKFYQTHLPAMFSMNLSFSSCPSDYIHFFQGIGFDDKAIESALLKRMSKIARLYLETLAGALVSDGVEPVVPGKFILAIDESFISNPRKAGMAGESEFVCWILGIASEAIQLLPPSALDGNIQEGARHHWRKFMECCYESYCWDGYNSTAVEKYKEHLSQLLCIDLLTKAKSPFIHIECSVNMDYLAIQCSDALSSLLDELSSVISDCQPIELPSGVMDNQLPIELPSGVMDNQLLIELSKFDRALELVSMKVHLKIVNGILVLLREIAEGYKSVDRHSMAPFYQVQEMAIKMERRLKEALPTEEQCIEIMNKIPMNEANDEAVRLSSEFDQLRNDYGAMEILENSPPGQILERYRKLKNEAIPLNGLLEYFGIQPVLDPFVGWDVDGEMAVYLAVKQAVGTFLDSCIISEYFSKYFQISWPVCVDFTKQIKQAFEIKEITAETFFTVDIPLLGMGTVRYGLLISLINTLSSHSKLWEYVDRLVHCSPYFSSGITLRAFVTEFNEEKALLIIDKMRSDTEIKAYLSTHDGMLLRNISTNTKGMVSNFSDFTLQLSIAFSDLDYINKFNKYNIYCDELKKVENNLIGSQKAVEMMGEIQKTIIDMENVFHGPILEKKSTLYHSAVEKYKRAVKCVAQEAELTKKVEDELQECFEELRILRTEVFNMLGLCRETAPRLYFVSDANLIRMINDCNVICEILPDIYNISEVIKEDGCIVGIKGGEESILFGNEVGLDGPVEQVFVGFENEMVNTMRNALECALYGNCPHIAVIQELHRDYLYFNGRGEQMGQAAHTIVGLESNDTLNSNGRGEQMGQAARVIKDLESPDLFNLYPKPSLSSDPSILHVGPVEYRFEYYPPSQFVFTKATARVFASIMLHLNRSGVVLYGPSGTGKTETIRHFCRTLGSPLVTFCCSERIEFASIRNVILGCIRIRGFVCFDEFNRLRREVMSAVTDCIYEHRGELKVFLTMNMGYKGRHELPRTLQATLGAVRLDEPDMEDIVRYHTGDARLHELLGELAGACSSAQHYDFGLRAVNSILRGAGPSRDDRAIIQSIFHFYAASLLPGDFTIFTGLLNKIYGNIPQPSENIMDYALRNNRGVLVWGTGGAGMLPSNILSSNCHIYNPSNILLRNESIFGSLDKSTGEWLDSPFLRDLRLANGNPANGNAINGNPVFVFDGPVASEWIEDFNSVLDENMVLCTSAGERIKVSHALRFVFIVDSIENLTPATLTRLFLIRDKGNTAPITANGLVSVLSVAPGAPSGLNGASVVLSSKAERTKEYFRTSLQHGSTIQIDHFEDAPPYLFEALGELSTRGTIGNVKYYNLRVYCVIEGPGPSGVLEWAEKHKLAISSVPEPSRLMAVQEAHGVEWSSKPAEEQSRVMGIVEFMDDNNLLDGYNYREIVGFISFCSKSGLFKDNQIIDNQSYENILHVSKQTNQINGNDIIDKRINQLHLSYNTNWLCDIINFYFGNSSAILFDPKSRTFKKDVCLDYNLSRLCCFLYYGIDVLVRGPRLAGKRRMVEEAISLLGSCGMSTPIRLIHWSESHETVDKSFTNVHIALSGASPSTEWIPCVELPSEEYALDCVKYCTELDSMGPETSLAYQHPGGCHHDILKFTNRYKYEDFKRMLAEGYLEFRARAGKRRVFLENGIKRIREFHQEADLLRMEIASKNKVLAEYAAELERLLNQLGEDCDRIRMEEEAVSMKKAAIEARMAVSLEKKKTVDEKLQLVEPLLRESREAIGNISKAHLTEIKTMGSPPEIIKETIRSVYYLLEGQRKTEWRELLLYIKKDDFISKVIGLGDRSSADISCIEGEFDDFLATPPERADKASRACGALFRWVRASVAYQRVCRDVLPLKEEIAYLNGLATEEMAELSAEERHLAEIRRQMAMSKRKEGELVDRQRATAEETERMKQKARLIGLALEQLRDEPEKWRAWAYECPISVVTGREYPLKARRNIFLRGEEELRQFYATAPSGIIRVSLNDQNCQKVLANAAKQRISVAIRDVDRFDMGVYFYLKEQMKEGGFYAVIHSNFNNYFSEETYEVALSPVVADVTEDRQTEAEERLIALLGGEATAQARDDRQTGRLIALLGGELEDIIAQTKVLADEREKAEKNRMASEFHAQAGIIYADLKKKCDWLSPAVFRELIEAESKGFSVENIRRRTEEFYLYSFPETAATAGPFDFGEIHGFGFDYAFIASFGDVVYQIKKSVPIDVEISAGAVESNRRIARLLEEKGNRTVLVKNAHFVPWEAKTGTNRFIFVFEGDGHHPLMEAARVVYYRQDASYESVYRTVLSQFKSDSVLVKFHSLVLSLGLEYSFGDLETALGSEGIGIEFLLETVYYSRMDSAVRSMVESKWKCIK